MTLKLESLDASGDYKTEDKVDHNINSQFVIYNLAILAKIQDVEYFFTYIWTHDFPAYHFET